MNTNPSLEHGTVGIAEGRSGRSPSLLRGILLPKTTRAGHEDTASDLIHSSELRKSDFRQKYDDKVIGTILISLTNLTYLNCLMKSLSYSKSRIEKLWSQQINLGQTL
jgi:hypothetical protein